MGAAVVLTVAVTGTPAGAAPADDFAFRNQPGTARWAAFTSYRQMVDATQMPAATARRLSTAALVRATLAYPLFGNILAYNNPQQGFEKLAQRFTGARELLRRGDAGTELLRRYGTATDAAAARGLAAATQDEQDRTRVELWQLETLLGQPPVLATLQPAQLDAALAVGERAFARKAAERTLYGTGGLEATTVTLGRALAVREGWDWRGVALLRGEPSASDAALAAVRSAAAAHRAAPGARHALADPPGDGDRPTEPGTGGDRPTEPGDGDRPTEPGDTGGDRPTEPGDDDGDRPTEPGTGGDRPTEPGDGGDRPTDPDTGGDRPTEPGDNDGDGDRPDTDDPDDTPSRGDEPITIRTPRGTGVTAQRQGSEMTESEMRYVQRQIDGQFPRAVQESSPTRRYNCHSFAWYSQSPTNDVWLDSPGDDAYWNDGSYRRWQTNQPAGDGMRVSWVYDDHSGIEVGRTGEVRSKWGQMPVMRAPVEYDPYDDLVLNHYVRR
ncbi:hypothetical protein GCM10010123_08290 [Pilimelia anulata]|uniref:Uncharacterized protein n=1 Tax=Pilimelia anulata TaxID=53371 RepID=A0A8J3B7A3_9ACTN|nr:hypothetical protein [Pilimelia anulata]GGJ80713.1 hypothetical protein GCM10010123_08290 [Pilimelia anulata]